MKNKLIIEQVKELIRVPYAFPGGYPKFLVMNDSECLCHNCAHCGDIIESAYEVSE